MNHDLACSYGEIINSVVLVVVMTFYNAFVLFCLYHSNLIYTYNLIISW